MSNRIIIDCDPGIDDAAAMFLALASPGVGCSRRHHWLWQRAGGGLHRQRPPDSGGGGTHRLPVYAGAGKPLLRGPQQPGGLPHIHGDDGLGGLDLSLPPPEHGGGKHAALAILDLARESPRNMSVVALGRLTNVALALALEPDAAGALQRIVVMGGAVNVPGNVSPYASANLYEDPEAAAMVYRSGVPIVQVGLDVCNQVTDESGPVGCNRYCRHPGRPAIVSGRRLSAPFLRVPRPDVSG